MHGLTRNLQFPGLGAVVGTQGCSEKADELGTGALAGVRGVAILLGEWTPRCKFSQCNELRKSKPTGSVSQRVLGLEGLDGVGYTWRDAGEMTGISESRRAVMCASRIMVLFPTRMCLPSGRETGSPTPATANTRHSMHNCLINP